jgi:hypothetical protein
MQTDTQRIQCSQKQKQKTLNTNQFSRSKVIDCVGQFSQGSGTPDTHRDIVIAFSQLAVKGSTLNLFAITYYMYYTGSYGVQALWIYRLIPTRNRV